MEQTYRSLLTALLPPHTAIPLLPPTRSPDAARAAQIAALELHPTLEATLHILNADLASAHFLVRHMESVVPSPPVSRHDAASVWRQPIPQRPEDAALDSTAPPQVEGMLIHAILHRIEGDYENARLWYRNVYRQCKRYDGKTVFSVTWPNETISNCEEDDAFPGGPSSFLDRVRELQRGRQTFEGVEAGDEGSEERVQRRQEMKDLESESEREIRALLKWLESRFGVQVYQDASDHFVGKSEANREIAKKMIVGGEGWRQF